MEYGSIKFKETIDKKVVMDSDRVYSLVTLDTGDKFQLYGKSGHQLEAVGIGSKLKEETWEHCAGLKIRCDFAQIIGIAGFYLL